MTDGGELEELMNELLRAALAKHSLADIRVAVRAVYDRGVADGMEQMLYPGTPEEQRAAAERGREMLKRASEEAQVFIDKTSFARGYNQCAADFKLGVSIEPEGGR